MKAIDFKEKALAGYAVAKSELAKDAAAKAHIAKVAAYVAAEGALSANAHIVHLGYVAVFADGHVESPVVIH